MTLSQAALIPLQKECGISQSWLRPPFRRLAPTADALVSVARDSGIVLFPVTPAIWSPVVFFEASRNARTGREQALHLAKGRLPIGRRIL
jgi:hypothetical protein